MSENLDSIIPFSKEEIDLIYVSVDDIMDKANIAGPEIALDYAAKLRAGGQARGYALAHLLWRLKQQWKSFPTDDDFEDAIWKALGYSTDTTYRYVHIWDNIFANEKVPLAAKTHLLQMPINTTYALVSPTRQGELDDEDWEEIEEATDKQAISEIISKAKGKEKKENPNLLVIILEKDGRLRCRKGQEKYEDFGFLNLEKETDSVKAAIDRLLNKGGVVRR